MKRCTLAQVPPRCLTWGGLACLRNSTDHADLTTTETP